MDESLSQKRQSRASITNRRNTRLSLIAAQSTHDAGEARPEYSNPIELLLTLVGYAVGLGNIWRFPYLAYKWGGGAFLIPYFTCLFVLGIPLFILEMGLGQIFRQGTFGIYTKLGLPRLRGAGIAATTCTFFVSLYYNVILAWTIYYIGRTFGSMGEGVLPWTDQHSSFGGCPKQEFLVQESIAATGDWWKPEAGRYNQEYKGCEKDCAFWCPAVGLPDATVAIEGYTRTERQMTTCPALAAKIFWETQAIQQSSGLNEAGGFHWGLLLSFTIAWGLVYLIIMKGVESSGKVVYFTALMPYVALIAFFLRAITLDGAMDGMKAFLVPADWSVVFEKGIWVDAARQIFYSLGMGFGSLIAFASYSAKDTDFVKQSIQVAVINCGTSFFAGTVVFPILGFLSYEMSNVHPCMTAGDLADLSAIGLSGPSLAFVAFPIAISKMPGAFFWALLFFLMLFCLGIDSQFAMVESVMTVLHDAKVGEMLNLGKEQFAAVICAVCWFLGLPFMLRSGVYWFNLYDYFSCNVALFLVTFLECFAIAWANSSIWPNYTDKVEEWTGRRLSPAWLVMYKAVNPLVIVLLLFLAFSSWDVIGAATSKPYPEGSGFYPWWSNVFGWFLALAPVAGFIFGAVTTPAEEARDLLKSNASAPSRGSNVEMFATNSEKPEAQSSDRW